MLHRFSASTTWYAYEAATSFLNLLAFTVTAVYYVTKVGMSPLQLVLVGTLMEVTIFAFEIPTGIVADIRSRRLSIVVGTFVMGVSIVLCGALDDVWPILAANALWGFGYTFTSGATDAWLADEVGQERLAGVYLRGAQMGRIAALAGIAAFAGMWSEGYDRLWQAHFIRDVGLPSVGGLDPVVWFGVFGAGTILLSIAVAHPLGKRLEHGGLETMARTLFWLDASLLVSALAFGLAGQFWLVLVAYFAVGLARNVANPIFRTWLNRNVEESGVRATVLSITNQADAVGQWTGGPTIGLIGNAFSIRAALSVGALCMAPALALYRGAARHHGEAPALESVPPASEG